MRQIVFALVIFSAFSSMGAFAANPIRLPSEYLLVSRDAVDAPVTATEFAQKTIYHSPQSPGFTCWVGAWVMPDKSTMVAFTQATGPVNGRPRTDPKILAAFPGWPPEGQPNYDMNGTDLKNVYLHSTDASATWRQLSADSFRSCMNHSTGRGQVALSDGTIVRAVWGQYLPFDDKVPKTGYIQRSRDNSKTWGKPETPLLDPKHFTTYPTRLRLLRDGRLIVTGGLLRVPAGTLPKNVTVPPIEPMLMVSDDGGLSWSKPIEVVPERDRVRWSGEEYDTAELANGDLLCVFRTVDPERKAKLEIRWQGVLKKDGKSWKPCDVGPSTLGHSGHPELLATKEGVVLHIATDGIHYTADAGKSWRPLPGSRASHYYPRSVQHADGRIDVYSHVGGDDAYGAVDQSIVMQTFKLKVAPVDEGKNSSAPTTILKSESFDKDPGWEGHNNRIVPKKAMIVTQDFGYSATNFAGKAKSEIGGRIQRSTTPASYAAKIEPKTLDDKLTASGNFAMTTSQAGAGVFFGFFNSQQPGGSGRPIGSLGLDFDFEAKGGRLAVRLITGDNKSCGIFITPYLPGKFRPTPLKCDGTKYHWTLNYDPLAAAGLGRFTFTLNSDAHTTQDYGPLPDLVHKEAQARFPNTTTFIVDLTPGFKKTGTTFDRFGIQNMMKAGGTATMFFDDLQFNGRAEDFATNPEWEGVGNRVKFDDRELVGAHDFGFSAKTNRAGGTAAGEVGGSLWRSGDYGYYADRVGPVNLNQRLEARGKVKLVTAGPDSDIYLGWFTSTAKDKSPADTGHFVGAHVGGPTRVGHYFNPAFATAKGTIGKIDQGPILSPGKVFDWSLSYDPAANSGHGEMKVTLGAETVTLRLKPGQKAEGASLDRFGLFTSTAGGQMVKIYLDDLQYTAAGQAP